MVKPFSTGRLLVKHLFQVLLLCIAMILVSINVTASSAAYSSSKVLDLETYNSDEPISRYLSSFTDKETTLTIEDILEIEKSQWKSSNFDIPNLGLTSDANWYRLNLWNGSDSDKELLLSLELPTIDNYHVYIFSEGQMIEKYELGDSLPFQSRVIENRNFVNILNIKARKKITLYFRLQSKDSIQVAMYLKGYEKFHKSEQSIIMFLSMYMGAMIVMGFYNLFLFFTVKDKNYLFFSFFILSSVAFQISRSGIGFQYVWPNNPQVNQYFIPIASAMMAIGVNLFLYKFLIIKEASKLIQRILQFQILASLTIPFVTLYSYTLALSIVLILGGTFPAAAIIITISRYYDGLKYARLLMVGILILFSSILLLALSKAGIAPRMFITENGFEIGGVLTVILMSMALAQRIRSVSEKIIFAEHNALNNEKEARKEKERYLQLKIAAKDDEIQTREEILLARAESKAKSDFLAVMSHEIRTPMNGVLGMAEILSTTNLSAQQSRYVKIIEDSGKSLVNIINDILDFSKIEAGKVDLEMIDFELNNLCQDCISSFSLMAENKQIDTIVSIEAGTPLYLNSDPTRIKQILLNLISNAFKFTDSGRISLEVSKVDSPDTSEAEHLIKFAVKDTGIGIPEKHKSKLFNEFSQTDNSTTRNFGGTGLGLAICKKLTKLLGGEIAVNTYQEVGVTFWFTVKVTDAEESFIKEHFIPTDFLQNKRLLFVDDSPSFIESAKELISAWKVKVDFALSTEEFQSKLDNAHQEELPFDLICIDMTIPGKTVLECASIVTENSDYKNSKILFLSATNEQPDKEFLLKRGIEHVIEKPASAKMLLESFLDILEHGSIVEQQVKQQSHDYVESLENLSGKIALVAEDNPTNQIVVKKMLERLGIITHIVIDGEQAYNFIQEKHNEIDFVLMDCEMPNLDGYQATVLIREWEQDHNQEPLQIIALTAHALMEHRQKALDSGMNFHITKPINLKTLSNTISEALIKP